MIMYSTRSVCTNHTSTLHSPVNIECDALQLRLDVPPEPESSPRSTSLRRRYSPKPAIAHQASVSRQTRPAAKEQLLRSASILQRHVDPPEPHDAHHGFRRRDDARHALYYGEDIADILSFFFPSSLPF